MTTSAIQQSYGATSVSAIYPTTNSKTGNGLTGSSSTVNTDSTSVNISAEAQTLFAASQTNSTSSSGGTYDFTNMTKSQMRSAVNDLIKSGKMSLDESSALVPMMADSTFTTVSGSSSGPQADTPINFVSILQNGIAGAVSRGDSANAAFLTTGLDALQKLQGSQVASTTAQPNTTTSTAQTTNFGFPPQNAPQSVVAAWNTATAGLNEFQKSVAAQVAMFSDGQRTLSSLVNGQAISGSDSNTASPSLDWQQFSQNVVANLQNSLQYQTTPTEVANTQSMINTFQNFRSNLG